MNRRDTKKVTAAKKETDGREKRGTEFTEKRGMGGGVE